MAVARLPAQHLAAIVNGRDRRSRYATRVQPGFHRMIIGVDRFPQLDVADDGKHVFFKLAE